MTIEKDQLAGGLVLTGRYKGQEYKVLVLGDEAAGFGFELDGAIVYKSLSSAAKAAMGGGSVNGWRFFSIAGSEPSARPVPDKAKGKAVNARSLVQIKKRRKQDGCTDGEVAYFCSACMASFCLPKGETPEACPQGHPREVADDLASPAGDREAAASD
ncbi:MAG TPA: hypothetical protein VMU55_02720 [Solirubrobacteraceae bacterium]|nr:hypothetical protein [Solirubrobacteraceae bacterium]